jgi:CRISPR system Cascade subunit CasD
MMARVLLMRLDAPLMSFGGPVVDNYGYTEQCPGLSMITGLLGNALGYYHGEFDRLDRLQRRLRMAVRCDKAGETLVDYQTVALGQDFLLDDCAWTTRGQTEKRGGLFSEGTHIRYRHYLADAVYTVAIRVTSDHEPPSLNELAAALNAPARPLFIGRKCCLPSSPIFLSFAEAPTLLTALETFPRMSRVSRTLEAKRPSHLEAWWDPLEEASNRQDSREIEVNDERDWANGVHTGRRFIRHGRIDPPED